MTFGPRPALLAQEEPPWDKDPICSQAALLARSVSLQVWDSSSPTMRQHLDTGRVRVEVIRISNGSVIVEFNLLILEDLEVQEVSAEFLTALQNASLLEVVSGDTSLWGTWRSGWVVGHWVWAERPREPSDCLCFWKVSLTCLLSRASCL